MIAAFPEGGGAYGGSKRYLGRRASLVAGASLVIDYVLNVAVSVAAGVAALTSAFPGLLPYTVWLCLGVLAVVTAVNLRGIAHSARAFITPTVIFVGCVLAVIVVGLVRGEPAVTEQATGSGVDLQTVGLLLLLKAFANGCAALTGVEAIANAVPSFRKPWVKRAQSAEVVLGVLLAVMLLGLAVLIEKFSIRPADGVTVLSQVTEASIGHGFGFYLVQFTTVVLLALAANTSLIVVALPVIVAVMEWVNRFYRKIGDRLELGRTPSPPRPHRSLVVVPVGTVSRLTRDALAAALSLGDRVVAVYVTHPEDEDTTAEFLAAWERWNPGVTLVQLRDERRRLGEPLVEYLRDVPERQVFVLIAEVEPEHVWQRILQNQRGAVLAHVLRRETTVVVCRLRFRIDPEPQPVEVS